MYRTYNLVNLQPEAKFADLAVQTYAPQRRRVSSSLKSFTEGGRIDGSKLQDAWFPKIKSDVFISHSHQDLQVANTLAGFLHWGFGISSFVDSWVWGDSLELQKEIDKVHCWDEERGVFDYDGRNVSTSHVHMILATAISRSMDLCECIIFVSTPQSVVHRRGSDPKVNSPWLLYELSMMQTLQPRDPERLLLEKIATDQPTQFSAKQKAPHIEYDADFSRLPKISEDTLCEWYKKADYEKLKSTQALDILYQMTTPNSHGHI